MMEKIEDFILKISIKLSRKHPKIYLGVNVILLLSICTMLSFLPYIYKAISYPVFYEKEIVSGIIENIIVEKRTVAKRYGTTKVPVYYFDINDTYVHVTPSIRREYEVGDVYEYAQYTRGEKVIGESREYSLVWGILALMIEICIVYVLLFLLWFYFDTEGKLKKKRARGLSVPVDYSQLSKKELYKLCRLRGISIIESKRENQKYLEECLRKDDSIDKTVVEQKPQYELWERVGTKIAYVLLILVFISFSVFIYHFIYLFT